MATRAEVLTLTVGSEVNEFEVTHCRSDPYQTGNMVVEGEVTAVGTFRGQPAAVFMWLGNSDLAADPFSDFSVYLTELSTELQTLPPLEAKQRIADDYEALNLKGVNEIVAEYSHDKMANVPPDQIPAKIMEMQQKLDEHEKAVKEEWVSNFESEGVVAIDGSRFSFEGSDLMLRGGEPGEAFADVSGAVKAGVECSR